MQSSDVFALVQAGGAGGRMDVPTLERPEPARPLPGSCQALDFSLSDLMTTARAR